MELNAERRPQTFERECLLCHSFEQRTSNGNTTLTQSHFDELILNCLLLNHAWWQNYPCDPLRQWRLQLFINSAYCKLLFCSEMQILKLHCSFNKSHVSKWNKHQQPILPKKTRQLHVLNDAWCRKTKCCNATNEEKFSYLLFLLKKKKIRNDKQLAAKFLYWTWDSDTCRSLTRYRFISGVKRQHKSDKVCDIHKNVSE